MKNSLVFIPMILFICSSCNKNEYSFVGKTFSMDRNNELLMYSSFVFINDSMVKYESSTDLASYKVIGYYQIINNKLYISYIDSGFSSDSEMISPYYHLLNDTVKEKNNSDSIEIALHVLSYNPKYDKYEYSFGNSYIIKTSNQMIADNIFDESKIGLKKSYSVYNIEIYYQSQKVISIPISLANNMDIFVYYDLRWLYYQPSKKGNLKLKINKKGSELKNGRWFYHVEK